MNGYKRIISLLLIAIMCFLCCGCNNEVPPEIAENSSISDVSETSQGSDIVAESNDIVVLYTNDIHCAFESEIGFSGLASYKKAMSEKTPYVTLVDMGDAIQGEVIGSVSKGEYLLDMMNYVGYDLAVFGNHEFDYGMEQLKNIVSKANHTYLCSNLTYTGKGENLLADVKPYEIISYGDTTVAYIGVTTPETLTAATPTYFMEEGEFVYGFMGGNDKGESFYAGVQSCVNECRSLGADYVVLMTHLGDLEESAPYTSVELIHNIKGADVVLDGHAHNEISSRIERDKEGKQVVLSSTGTKFANIGQLVITEKGNIFTGLVSDYTEKDAETDKFITEVKSLYDAEVNRVVGISDIDLKITDANGIRLVRNRETPIANLCADAYRYITGADIALVNGGGVRADILKGEITYADIISVHPFGNALCVVEATGQEILDSLEIASRATQKVYEENGYAVGEEGSFQHVSGMKYTIDTSIPAGVSFDENGMFAEFTGERRVKNVMILGADGIYAPLDPQKIYTVASHNHLIKSGGGGITQFTDNKLLINEGISDYQVLITYIVDVLGGKIGDAYSSPEGRITIE
ncbi:MAG: bifunctional metallophosphatase/5'-nucleotidase [Ruminococcaceae bacterium]|nr:bifunctional metallophosphatase/5'-nucleotidase [Oscillospiraceae bacterium]